MHKKLYSVKKALLIVALFSCTFFAGLQEAQGQTATEVETERFRLESMPENTRFRIVDVIYDITGITTKYALQNAVYIDTGSIFADRAAFENYLTGLHNNFDNIRTLDSTNLEPLCESPDADGISPVRLIVHTKDTFNILVIPYPRYDSNSGFLMRLKFKDNNFLGMMRPFDFGISFKKNKQIKNIATDFSFSWPYKAGPLSASQSVSGGFDIDIDNNKNKAKTNASFNLSTSSAFSYFYKFLSVIFGGSQGMDINKNDGAPIGKRGYNYHMHSSAFVNLPLYITPVGKFGMLTYTPSFWIGKNWTFKKQANEKLKGTTITVGQSLGFGSVSWKSNFREGLTFNISNNYTFNTATKAKLYISLDTVLTGYISFLDKVGIYGRASFLTNYNKVMSQRGYLMRGILDRRLNSDFAMIFNLDVPIKILDLNFEEITGKHWPSFFDMEIQLSPFLDFALTHDPVTKRYFSFKDSWCSGGFEVIVYPKKARSIYVRSSIGFDLRELKNVPGLLKRGPSKRDGISICEIFIGIGLFY